MSKTKSFVGYKHGRIEIVARVFASKNPTLWWYACTCGNWSTCTASAARRKTKTVEKSCGCANREKAAKLARSINFVDLTNKRFGRWKVLRIDENIRADCSVWLCKCDCGTIRSVSSGSLRQKRSTSCGCYQREIAPELALHMSKNRRSSTNLSMRPRANLTNSLRYSRQRDATPPWVSRKELRLIYENRPKGYHVDHIHPLKHPLLCGLHVPWNLQYLPATDNLRKRNSLEL